LHLHEIKSPARCCFRGAQAHQQLVAGRQASPHGTELSEQAGQTLAAHGGLFVSSSCAFGQHIELAFLLEQFHFYRLCLPIIRS